MKLSFNDVNKICASFESAVENLIEAHQEWLTPTRKDTPDFEKVQEKLMWAMNETYFLLSNLNLNLPEKLIFQKDDLE